MSDETCCGACGYPVHATKEMACDWCRQAADRIEALTKERDAARQDAKAAEDELEMQEQEACMMENDYIKLEKERDALEAKLAKTVEALRQIADPISLAQGNVNAEIALATLAEIKGESHD